VSVTGVGLPVADDTKVLGVVFNQHLTFHKHVSTVARSCNYHAQTIRHLRHLLTTELAQTLACSLILSKVDYCNVVLYSTPNYNIKMLQRVQNTRLGSYSKSLDDPTHAVTQAAALAAHSTADRLQSGPADVQGPQHIDAIVPSMPDQGAGARPQPTIHHHVTVSTIIKDNICKARFFCTVPAIRNSLWKTVIDSDSITVFKSRLKTLILCQAYSLPFSHSH